MLNNNTPESGKNLIDGLFRQNVVLMTGLVVSPVVAGATTLVNGLIIALVFSIVSFITVAVCSRIPRKIVYTVRVILYTLVASVVYIPVMLFLKTYFSDVAAEIGVYLAILISNPLILSKTESRFYLRSFGYMLIDVLVFIAGFDIVCITISALREILTFGTILGFNLGTGFTVPALGTTFGGFILLGVLAGLCRAVYNFRKKRSGALTDADELSQN